MSIIGILGNTYLKKFIQFYGGDIMWEDSINISEIREIRSRTTVYLGIGAIGRINDIAEQLRGMSKKRILIVTGKNSYRSSGAWEHIENALKLSNIEYVLYDGITPNPVTSQVDEAAVMGREFGAGAVLGIGGGSPIDAAKSAAILLEYTDKSCRELYEFKFAPERAVPVIAVNLTHGTGSEIDRFAVISIPEMNYKPAIAYDCIYPLYSIDDPSLMTKLPREQSVYVSVDAVNHAIEASTSKLRSPYSIMLARETVRLVIKYLPRVMESPDDLKSRYFLAYASMIAGICFDNGMLHLTHALEHPLSAVKGDLPHGMGLAVLLPSVIKTIYPAVYDVLSEVLSPMAGMMRGTPDESEKLGEYVKQWLRSVRLGYTLSSFKFTENDVSMLTNLAFNTPSLGLLLSMAPVEVSRETVSRIYRDSL